MGFFDAMDQSQHAAFAAPIGADQGHSLAVMDYDAASHSFGGLADIASDGARILGWPAFTPDGKSVVYHAGTSQAFETDANASGDLFVTDIPYGRIFRISLAGQWQLVAEYDGEPNGMKLADPETLLITDYKNGLMRLDLRSGRVEPFLDRRNSERFKGVNDLVFDRRGNLYFTDQGQTGLQDPTGRLYRLSPEGRLDMLLGNVPSPNGVALSPDEKVLYLAVTRGNQVWRVPLQEDAGTSGWIGTLMGGRRVVSMRWIVLAGSRCGLDLDQRHRQGLASQCSHACCH